MRSETCSTSTPSISLAGGDDRLRVRVVGRQHADVARLGAGVDAHQVDRVEQPAGVGDRPREVGEGAGTVVQADAKGEAERSRVMRHDRLQFRPSERALKLTATTIVNRFASRVRGRMGAAERLRVSSPDTTRETRMAFAVGTAVLAQANSTTRSPAHRSGRGGPARRPLPPLPHPLGRRPREHDHAVQRHAPAPAAAPARQAALGSLRNPHPGRLQLCGTSTRVALTAARSKRVLIRRLAGFGARRETIGEMSHPAASTAARRAPRAPANRGADPGADPAAGRRAVLARDAGLRRISRATRWIAAGAVGLSGALAVIAADSFRGHAASTASTQAPASQSAPASVPPVNSGGNISAPASTPAPTAAPPVAVSGGS